MPLSDPQNAICSSDARFRVAVTGRRFGKTHVAMRELARWASEPDSQVWYVAPSYRMAKGIVWDQLKKKLKDLRWVEATNEAELKLRLKNGSVIHLKGADSPDSLRGVGLDGIILDEFQDIDPRVWTEVLRPTLSDKGGKAMFLGTPRGVGSFSHEMYTMAQATDNWDSFTFTTLEGGNVPQSEIEEAKRDMDAKTFEQEYLATFNTYSGVVYYNFDRNYTLQQCQGKFDTSEIHIGQDFNVGALASSIAVIENNVIYFIDELLLDSSSTEDTCDELKRRYPNSIINVYPDPAGKQRKTSAGGRTDISILQNAGFKVHTKNSHTPVRDRVNAVNTKLKNANGQPALFVDPKCKHVINSLEKMVYKQGTNVIDKDGKLDHMADSVGYLVDFLYPVRTDYAPQDPQRWAFTGNSNTARRWS